jgi:hypothetical protein
MSYAANNTKRFFLAWQSSEESRAWYPIGRLDASKDRYSFGYTQGAIQAKDECGFAPIIDFPDFQKRYDSEHLFSLFSNRAMSKGRVQEYLKLIDLEKLSADSELGKLEMLAVDGGYRATDAYHVFPDITTNAQGCFTTRFFLHGWRYMNADTKKVIADAALLKAGDELYVSVELNNPTGIAVMLHSGDYHTLGWSPRYLAHDLVNAMANSPTKSDIKAKVVQINPAPAPSKQRVLIELSAHFPEGYEPLNEKQFKLLIPS